MDRGGLRLAIIDGVSLFVSHQVIADGNRMMIRTERGWSRKQSDWRITGGGWGFHWPLNHPAGNKQTAAKLHCRAVALRGKYNLMSATKRKSLSPTDLYLLNASRPASRYFVTVKCGKSRICSYREVNLRLMDRQPNRNDGDFLALSSYRIRLDGMTL